MKDLKSPIMSSWASIDFYRKPPRLKSKTKAQLKSVFASANDFAQLLVACEDLSKRYSMSYV